MLPKNETHYFLGANSPGGFVSLYDQLINPAADNCRLFLLKGGPGCGKSSFMKRIAHRLQKAGCPAELIHCSGDPDSLDGVLFPTLHTAYADATAPHVLEPKSPAAVESYINLGQFYDCDALMPLKNRIQEKTAAYKALYADAYDYTRCAGILADQFRRSLRTPSLIAAIEKRSRGIIAREIARCKPDGGECTERFLSGLTCQGAVCRFDTVQALAQRVYVLDNDFFLAPILLNSIRRACENAGLSAVFCPDPLCPEELAHILIPSLSLAFVSSTDKMPYPYEAFRHIRLNAMAEKHGLHPRRGEKKALIKQYSALLDSACSKLQSAKALHDELEKIYNPHVDFEQVYRLADAHVEALLTRL